MSNRFLTRATVGCLLLLPSHAEAARHTEPRPADRFVVGHLFQRFDGAWLGLQSAVLPTIAMDVMPGFAALDGQVLIALTNNLRCYPGDRGDAESSGSAGAASADVPIAGLVGLAVGLGGTTGAASATFAAGTASGAFAAGAVSAVATPQPASVLLSGTMTATGAAAAAGGAALPVDTATPAALAPATDPAIALRIPAPVPHPTTPVVAVAEPPTAAVLGLGLLGLALLRDRRLTLPRRGSPPDPAAARSG